MVRDRASISTSGSIAIASSVAAVAGNGGIDSTWMIFWKR